MAPGDAELLDALRQRGGEREAAWSELVCRYSPRMYAVARSFALDPATAENLVQTAWLRLVERVDHLRDAGAVGPWLCAVVRNEARKLVTRRRDVPSDLRFADYPAPVDAPEASLIGAERAKALRLAFALLGEECRQLLRLMTADPPLSYDELSAATGRPRGSLGPTRRRCLDQLRQRLPVGFEP